MTNRKAIIQLQSLLEERKDYLDDLDPECGAVIMERDYINAIKLAIVALEKLENAVDDAYLTDWYINSVTDDDPVWTDAHIKELTGDFIIIPKEDTE